MKVTYTDKVLTLRAETDEEKAFLDQAGIEGLRNFGRGSYNTLSLPSIAGLKQSHLTTEQLRILMHAFGRSEEYLREAYGAAKIKLLLSELTEVK